MAHDAQVPLDRREFLQTGAVATAAALTATTLTPGSKVAAQGQASMKTLPRRTLGRTGVDVTILNHGTWRAPGLDRLLRFSYASGVRYFDTAKSYGSEPALKRWFQANRRSARRSSWSPRTIPTRPVPCWPNSTNDSSSSVRTTST